ncbi:valine--tRNA ligase [Candidatus Roizmanbacteria bacterium RIFCSPHIGHO2_01_FULL_39_12b]|uniref:Valine--tRNA ligase n=1 Tax=Candidatus Roizmanbacteria bacterium RIFCSPHIGHO2_01_FULL_39_12b TaxID=1802030 RepID=A0A1F7GCJ3_9BACT|nr:MAG: valine--tRNA ligase [Candidatus Roizmanbacteria bacterium RIFCSPHIGHO2_01_FULL_39_12b]OGK46693.1 MAG: valine--tRNA ligase [Candidatus Roizmanbacteria bacterium RIFCSPLOWO2_01_FULL_39_19]
MNKRFDHSTVEPLIYSFWENKNLLKAPNAGKPYTVLMPPPNANASLHAGHGMYVIDDIAVRYKRLGGFSSLWIPGMDHAGFETQYVYEKKLTKEGKSRLNFDRKTLYENIFKFVKDNSGLIYQQFKRLGFLADWDRSVFTLDQKVIDRVYETFKRMIGDGLVYRDEYIVNYCVHCGTSLAELEIKHIERVDPLYFIKYPLIKDIGFVTVATVRPEPIFADTHLAVNPHDKKNKQLIGKKVENPITGDTMDIIGDEYVDPNFGTGVIKLTPAHDPNDWQIAKKKGLPIIQAIDWRGRMIDVENTSGVHGMKVKAAREAIVKKLHDKKLIEKIYEKHFHSVITCYKCGRDLEPLIIPNWFIKVDELKKPIIKAVTTDDIFFHPKKYKKQMLQWLEIMHDWPISRQIVWGIRIPVWYKIDRNHDTIAVRWIDKQAKTHTGSLITELAGADLRIIKEGLQEVVAAPRANYVVSVEEPKDGEYIPETDTFDTWFSSGQWPLVTLKEDEFKTRFPTDMMGTLADILKFWVSRMVLFSLYLKNEVPFKNVYLWSMIADKTGAKMSKSKGNVVNPINFIDTYGADAFRASLLFGIGEGGTVVLSEDKVRAMRNFANKLWNIGRFIDMNETATLQVTPLRQGFEGQGSYKLQVTHKKTLKELEKEFSDLKKKYIKNMDNLKFSRCFDDLYEFVWHRFADYYVEELKDPIKNSSKEILTVLEETFKSCLLLLHPFMPFVTEAIWQEFNGQASSILNERLNKNIV